MGGVYGLSIHASFVVEDSYASSFVHAHYEQGVK